MAMKLYPDTAIQDIADAIRAKNGSSDTYTVGQMAAAISNIPSGGGGISIDDIATNTAPSGDIVFNGTTIGRMAFAGKPITSFSGPNVTSIGFNAFGRCDQMTRLSLPSLTSLTSGIQANDNNAGGLALLEELDIPSVRTIAAQVLKRLPRLQKLILPSLASLSANSLNSEDSGIAIVDIGVNLSNIPQYGFTGCTARTIILRKSDSIVTCSNVNGLLNPSSGTVNYYVPSALISTYQTATNWATRYDAGKATFIALEGSAYEDPDWYLSE